MSSPNISHHALSPAWPPLPASGFAPLPLPTPALAPSLDPASALAPLPGAETALAPLPLLAFGCTSPLPLLFFPLAMSASVLALVCLATFISVVTLGCGISAPAAATNEESSGSGPWTL